MANDNIKSVVRQNRIRMWEIADRMGISENTLFRKMRHELTPEEQKQILSIVEDLSKKTD